MAEEQAPTAPTESESTEASRDEASQDTASRQPEPPGPSARSSARRQAATEASPSTDPSPSEGNDADISIEPDEAAIARVKHLGRYVFVRRLVTLCSVFISALLQAFVIQAFINPAGLLSSGFTGVAILIDRVTSLVGFSFPTQLGMLALNFPVALLCWRSISKRFVIFSMLQVALASFFLQICTFRPLLDSTVLMVLFGGVLYGISISLALKSGASTAGTDFIALMVSNKTGKTIWGYVFAGNCMVLAIFGAIFGWEYAAYSIVFQFLSTKTIDSFYHRYERVTLQITTEHPERVCHAYTSSFRHGVFRADGVGGYSGRPMSLLNTVVSSYEASDVIKLVRTADPRAVINIMKTEDFVGNFHRTAVDEPLPTEVPETPKEDPVLDLPERVRHRALQRDKRGARGHRR